MIIRHARGSDVDRLEQFAAGMGLDTSGHPFALQVDDPGHAVFVADVDERIVGFISLRELSGPLREQYTAPMELWGLFVHPDVQGHGVARSLMGRGLVHAHSRECDVIWAAFEASNGRAISFLGKCGFRQMRRQDLTSMPQQEVILACVLS